ncbi:MAG: hypothetical protein RIA62_13960 [Cyclobacteriaceae bacterium]
MKIVVEPLFLPQFKIFGALIILFGIPGFYALAIPLMVKLLLWVVVLGIGSFLLLGTQILEIDKNHKKYRSAVSLLGLINMGAWKSYNSMDNIFIKKSRVSQKMALGPIENTLKGMVFDAYLKISESEKIFLGSNKSKERLLRKINPMKAYLDIPLVDHTA